MSDADIDRVLASLGDGSEECRILIGIIDHQRRVIADLQAQLEEARRNQPGPTAPFRVADEKRVSQPKKPGRKAGHPGSCRPKPDAVDETIQVPLHECPNCHGPVTDVRPIEQTIEEIPPIRPVVTRLTTYRAQCPNCGTVQSTHPLQTSTAAGAAGRLIGPRATSLAASLLHQHGLSKRRVASILKDCLGLSVSAGGLVHLSHRLARRLAPQFQALHEHIVQASSLHVDETSWYVGKPGYTLWVFTTKDTTFYCVRDSRARIVVYEVLGTNFPGVLITDCLSVYDGASPVQHKCYAHHLRAVSQMARRCPAAAEFCQQITCLLHRAMMLATLRPVVPEDHFVHARTGLEDEARRLFSTPRASPDEERLANRFRKQLDHLFTFLYYPGVDATNNLAERQLRPAVISRKNSCGNRTTAGAATWEVLTSLAATCRQRGTSFIDLAANSAALSPAFAPAR